MADVMPACPQCGSTVWQAVEVSIGAHTAVEKRECENDHRWTEVLDE